VIDEQVKVISISWGILKKSKKVETALKRALEKNILIFASASNNGAKFPITFPAAMDGVFCIGSADGLGWESSFNPVFWRVKKYSAVGEGIVGPYRTMVDRMTDVNRTALVDGTSTATPVAAGIACLLLEYMRQFKSRSFETRKYMSKLFTKMSAATAGNNYRFLAPWYLFPDANYRQYFDSVLQKPEGRSMLPC
jgi:subtilisin family serine protease